MTGGMGSCHNVRLRVPLRLPRRLLLSIGIHLFHQNWLNVVFNLFVVILGWPPSATRFATILLLQLLSLFLLLPLFFGNQFSNKPLCQDHSGERLNFHQALKDISSLWHHSFSQEYPQIRLYQGSMGMFRFFKFHLLHKLRTSITLQNILDHWRFLIPYLIIALSDLFKILENHPLKHFSEPHLSDFFFQSLHLSPGYLPSQIFLYSIYLAVDNHLPHVLNQLLLHHEVIELFGTTADS